MDIDAQIEQLNKEEERRENIDVERSDAYFRGFLQPWELKRHYDYDQVLFKGDAARVQKDGKWGIVDRKGEILLPIIYDYIWPFSSKESIKVRINEDIKRISLLA